jgi:hypothetical protein
MHHGIEQLQCVHRRVFFNNPILCKKPIEFSALAFRSGAVFSTKYLFSRVTVKMFSNCILVLHIFWLTKYPLHLICEFFDSPKTDQVSFSEHVSYFLPGGSK